MLIHLKEWLSSKSGTCSSPWDAAISHCSPSLGTCTIIFTSLFLPSKFLANVNWSRIWSEALIGWGSALSGNYVYKWPFCQLAEPLFCLFDCGVLEKDGAWIKWDLYWACSISLAYSFEPRPNNHMLAIVSFFMTIGLSINRQIQARKNGLTRENNIDWSRTLGCGNFKSLTWFSQNLLLSSSLKKTTGDSVPHRVMNEGQNIKM